MKRWIRTIPVAITAAMAAGSAAVAAPVGVATHLSGKAEVQSGGGAWKPLKMLQRLEPGDTVRCATGAEAVIVLFASAERYKVPAGGKGVVNTAGVTGASKVATPTGPSMRLAKAMGGSRGGIMARPPSNQQRINPKVLGWLPLGERQFTWNPTAGAVSYTFTLMDQYDNIVWSTRVSGTSAEYPVELPPLSPRQPYVWRLCSFTEEGKVPQGVQGATRWGVITFLSPEDTAKMAEEEKELLAQRKANPGDATWTVLLAELYRDYGVMQRTLETLDDLYGEGYGVEEAVEDAYRQTSPYALSVYRAQASK